jgi:hypothetical protein
MKSSKPVIILAGQVFFDDGKNEYLVVKHKHGEVVTYSGHGFRGMLEEEVFLEKFQPVDPEDLTVAEADYLSSLCAEGTTLKIGFIND